MMSPSITEQMSAAASGLLAGRRAIVTGAYRGIGHAIATGYARAGPTVCCISRTMAEIDETAERINELLPGHIKSRVRLNRSERLTGRSTADVQTATKLRSAENCKQPEDVAPLAQFLACKRQVGSTAQSFSLAPFSNGTRLIHLA